MEATEAGVDLDAAYQRGRSRLDSDGSWKVWNWDSDSPVFICAETFRKEALESRVPSELLPLLPREEGKPMEKPAEAALRERMTTLINNIHTQLQSAQEAWRRGQRTAAAESGEPTRDANIDLVISILDALQNEHHCLYQMILIPVADFVCNLIPAKNRKTTKTELFFEDFDKLAPEDVAKLYEWLTEKVDALCSKLKPDPKDEDIDEDEEAVGDIDLFSLTPDKSSFTVNPKWMEHLQERKLSDEGQPRKVKKGEDEHKVGLVLEWVYGSIVSTAEKARDGSKRALGDWTPTVHQAKSNLIDALKDQQEWDQRSKTARALLKDLLSMRKRMNALAKEYDVCIPGTSTARESGDACEILPDPVIEGILHRESLLTNAKLHILKYDRMLANKQLKNLKSELVQGEPEFERLKRELENSKVVSRTDKDSRIRAKISDTILEDQLEVQSAFREQGARLQGLYDKRQRTEVEITRREQEINQLENWEKNVNQLLKKFQNANEVTNMEQSEAPAALLSARKSFHKDFKKQLYSDLDDQTFSSRIKSELKKVDKRVEDGAVVLQHLEMFLINIACDDPGALIGSSVILPLLQERLDEKAMEYSMQRASEAMNDLIQMEEERKLMLAKKETKKKSKIPSIVEDILEDFPPAPSSTEELSSEAAEKMAEDLDLEATDSPAAQDQVNDASFNEPSFEVEKSTQNKVEYFIEDETEFQSVKRRQDRRRFQGKKSFKNGTSPWQKFTNSKPVRDPHQKQSTHELSSGRKPRTPVVLAVRSKSAKLTSDQRGFYRKQGLGRYRSQSLKKAQSLPEPPMKDMMDSRTQENKSSKPMSTQSVQAPSTRWVKGTHLVWSTTQSNSPSESSVHVPRTPDALDMECDVISEKSEHITKTQMTLHDMKTALPQQSDIQELHGSELATSPQPTTQKIEQNSNQNDPSPPTNDVVSDLDGFEPYGEDERSGEELTPIHSSDSETPEPEHMMMGPPLMPPPMGMPPPIGPMPPAFHPNYYNQIRPMMGGLSVPMPPHLPPVYQPCMTSPMTGVDEEAEENEVPCSSTTHSSLHPYPYYPHPHMMAPHAGHHMPMPAYPMVMPYGQWFPPGMHMIGPSAHSEHDSHVKNFPLRPTAEEFVPPSLRQEEEEVLVEEYNEFESEDQIVVSEDNREEYDDEDCGGGGGAMTLREVEDSSVTLVTPIIKQTC
eukprot:g2401.t1